MKKLLNWFTRDWSWNIKQEAKQLYFFAPTIIRRELQPKKLFYVPDLDNGKWSVANWFESIDRVELQNIYLEELMLKSGRPSHESNIIE